MDEACDESHIVRRLGNPYERALGQFRPAICCCRRLHVHRGIQNPNMSCPPPVQLSPSSNSKLQATIEQPRGRSPRLMHFHCKLVLRECTRVTPNFPDGRRALHCTLHFSNKGAAPLLCTISCGFASSIRRQLCSWRFRGTPALVHGFSMASRPH